ncbi:MAG: murein biosynthesis integral membrane protein MurJ [Candidatus Hydrogenedentota bacterium]|nr:MAG: murein biosynthesis integral membrane protein MurJ [Candidatus Hydrogenedentota bacterium]
MQSNRQTNNRQENVKNTAVFSFFTIISRILGLLRDMLKAWAFGTGPMAVAFDIAFRLPNMLRNLAAEGAFSQAFIPLYEKYKHENNGKDAAGAILVRMFFILGILTLFVILSLPYVLPSLINDPNSLHKETQLAVDLSRLLFPYILFISLATIFMGIEYSRGVFWAPALGPALMNFVIISLFLIGIWLLPIQNPTNKIYIWSFAILAAAIFQMSFQAIMTKKMGFFPRLRFSHPVLSDLWKMMLPAIFAAAAQELGQLADIFLATLLREKAPGAVSALTYAHRLNHLPIGVFAVAVATASLPQLSRLFQENKKEEYEHALGSAISLNLFLLLPSALGLFLFAKPIIGLLFERGSFSLHSTESTALALRFYALGIPAFGMTKLFTSAFYARENSKVPALITAFTLTMNISISILLMQSLLHGGLALGSSLASWAAILFYAFFLAKKYKVSFLKDHLKEYIKILFVNALWFITLFFVARVLIPFPYWQQIVIVLPLAAGFYFLLSHIFRVEELYIFIRLIQSKIKR